MCFTKHLVVTLILSFSPLFCFSGTLENREDLKVAESVTFVIEFKDTYWEIKKFGNWVKLYDRHIIFEPHKCNDMENYENRLDKAKTYNVTGIVIYMAYGMYHVLVKDIDVAEEN